MDHWRGREKEESSKLLRSHYFSIEKEKERERERGERVREREMRMRWCLGEILTRGRNFVVAGHRPLTRIPTWRQTPYLDLFRPPLGRVNTGRTWATVLLKIQVFLQIADAVCCDIDCSKVQSSRENAHIMLEMAGKCSNYARNWGLCFTFWIMLFEADYAKNYASILYQCLPFSNTFFETPAYCVAVHGYRHITGHGGFGAFWFSLLTCMINQYKFQSTDLSLILTN